MAKAKARQPRQARSAGSQAKSAKKAVGAPANKKAKKAPAAAPAMKAKKVQKKPSKSETGTEDGDNPTSETDLYVREMIRSEMMRNWGAIMAGWLGPRDTVQSDTETPTMQHARHMVSESDI